jgi:hypothetical protein
MSLKGSREDFLMGHEDYRELLALEAAGALAADESRALAEHLSSCGECRRELAGLRDTAAALLYTLPPVAPPARLRSQVLEQVRALGDAPGLLPPARRDPTRGPDSGSF